MKSADRDISSVIRNRRLKVVLFRNYVNMMIWLMTLLACVFVLLHYVFLITKVEGNDMFPALKDGDLVVGFRCQQEYRKNDVVVYTMDGKHRAGRIVAGEEDVVSMDASGTLRVNGTVQSRQIYYPTEGKENHPYRVEKGCVFILGDYCIESTDSRDFGAVPMAQVEAKVITLLRHRGI